MSLTRDEIKVVRQRAMQYPVVFEWGWHKNYPLSLHEVIDHPGYG
jgi:hypothetical protein